MTETKSEKFIRLCEQRTEKAIKAIELIGNLSSSNYESTHEQRMEVVRQLQSAVSSVAETFGVELVSKPEPEPEPEPEPDTYLTLSPEENLQMLRIGPRLGAAIEFLEDQKPEEAKETLLQLMVS